ANAVRLKSTASRTPSRMESRVRGNVQARFGEGDTPYPQGSTVPTLPMVRRHFNARKQVGIYPRKETIMWSSTVGCLVTLPLGLLAGLSIVTAQPQGKLPLVGVLEPGPSQPPTPCLQAFQQGLRDLGYVEGHTIRLAYRHAEYHVDRLPGLLAELVQLAPDVICLHSTPPALP